jgi:hypothetical protein
MKAEDRLGFALLLHLLPKLTARREGTLGTRISICLPAHSVKPLRKKSSPMLCVNRVWALLGARQNNGAGCTCLPGPSSQGTLLRMRASE